MITFSPAEIFAAFIAIVGLVLTILNIIDKSSSLKEKAAAPLADLERRVSEMEKVIIEHERLLSQNDERMADMEESYSITMRAMLALLGHAIDGNNDSQMREVRDDLNNYLTKKR